MMILRKKAKIFFKNYELYLFFLPTLIYFIVFHYGPMYGVQIAFKDFMASKGIAGSPWVGFVHFQRFFNSYQFVQLIRNTLVLSLYFLIAGFPIPVIFALLLNHLPSKRYKKLIQTVTYAPHFISIVVLVGMLHVFLSPRTGLVNQLIVLFGGERILFMGSSGWFRHLFVLSAIWQNTGWAAIIYIAALSGINPELHEAAIADGANKIKRIWYIDIPGIIPTIMILLILRTGRLMRLGFEKTFLMQSSLNLDVSEIISTYVYKVGLLGAQFSFSAAVGLFNALINLILLFTINRISKALSKTSLF